MLDLGISVAYKTGGADASGDLESETFTFHTKAGQFLEIIANSKYSNRKTFVLEVSQSGATSVKSAAMRRQRYALHPR